MEMEICRDMQILIDRGLIDKNPTGRIVIAEILTDLESESDCSN